MADSDNSRWLRMGWIDYDNAVGAKVRQRLRCIVEHIEAERWRLISLEISEL